MRESVWISLLAHGTQKTEQNPPHNQFRQQTLGSEDRVCQSEGGGHSEPADSPAIGLEAASTPRAKADPGTQTGGEAALEARRPWRLEEEEDPGVSDNHGHPPP